MADGELEVIGGELLDSKDVLSCCLVEGLLKDKEPSTCLTGERVSIPVYIISCCFSFKVC